MGDATPAARFRARRNLRLITGGVLASSLGGLGAAVLYSDLADTESVVAMRRTVYRGQQITAADLGEIALASGPGLDSVPALQVDDVVGQTALLDLAEGSLLTPQAVGAPVVDAGVVRLGLRLGPGRLPVTELPPSTPVLLIAVSAEVAPADAARTALTASSVTLLPDGAALLDVAVPVAAAVEVARLAAADELVLVRQAEGPP